MKKQGKMRAVNADPDVISVFRRTGLHGALNIR